MNFPLNTAIVHSLAHRAYGTLPELIFSALLPRNSLKAAIWGNHRAHLICFMSLKDYRLLLLNAQGLENCFYIHSVYLFISSERVNLVYVPLSYPEAEVPLFDF